MGVNNFKTSLEYEELKKEFEAEQEKNRSLTTTLDVFVSNNFVDDAVNKIQAAPNLDKKRDALKGLVSQVLSQNDPKISGPSLQATKLPTKEKEEDVGLALQQILTEENTPAPKAKKLRLM